MNSRIRTLMVHSLHLFALAVLGYFVWQDLRRDGEARLFESIKVTHLFARERLEEASEIQLVYVRRITDAYNNSLNQAFWGKTTQMDIFCDSVIQVLNNAQLPAETAAQYLSILSDSLSACVDFDPELSAQFRASLMRSGKLDLMRFLSDAGGTQQTTLRSDLQINIHLARWKVLNYLMQQISFCGMIDKYSLFLQPEIICPTANEALIMTGFLSTYSHLYLRPHNTKVFMNAKEASIKNGYAEFTTSFDKAGAQPLFIRIETRNRQNDTLRVFEKTYTVQVK